VVSGWGGGGSGSFFLRDVGEGGSGRGNLRAGSGGKGWGGLLGNFKIVPLRTEVGPVSSVFREGR